jgi:hypothetical protein
MQTLKVSPVYQGIGPGRLTAVILGCLRNRGNLVKSAGLFDFRRPLSVSCCLWWG